MYQKGLVCFYFLSLLSYFSALGQLPNLPFRDTLSVGQMPIKGLHLRWDYLGYQKNNEYFNTIADGYTIFGQQLIVSVAYRPAAYFTIEGGASFRRDFGVNARSEWLPVLRLKYERTRWAFLFGTLEGHLNHGLIEPLFDFERLLTRRLENGFQFWYKGNRLRAEAWIDWQRVIYAGSPFQEEIVGGAHIQGQISPELAVPLQITAFHAGGQIDTSSEPLVTQLNLALGLVWCKDFAEGSFLEQLEWHHYGLAYGDASFRPRQPDYTSGWGYYTHFNARLRRLGNIALSYWSGQRFVAPLGGDLYGSLSRRFDPPLVGESRRELLFLRLIQNLRLHPSLWLSLRAEPFWDFGSQKLEFSTGLYLVYRDAFAIKK
ncbi:MAG: hypothetical protein ACFCUI_02785 [Bernardetiaceae bacterium]